MAEDSTTTNTEKYSSTNSGGVNVYTLNNNYLVYADEATVRGVHFKISGNLTTHGTDYDGVSNTLFVNANNFDLANTLIQKGYLIVPEEDYGVTVTFYDDSPYKSVVDEEQLFFGFTQLLYKLEESDTSITDPEPVYSNSDDDTDIDLQSNKLIPLECGVRGNLVIPIPECAYTGSNQTGDQISLWGSDVIISVNVNGYIYQTEVDLTTDNYYGIVTIPIDPIVIITTSYTYDGTTHNYNLPIDIEIAVIKMTD